MPDPSAEIVDLASTLEQALGSASSGLSRAAIELGAQAAAVLLAAGSKIEITYFWSSLGGGAPTRRFASSAQVRTSSGPVEPGTPLAGLLRESISPGSQSFLLFPWHVRERVVSVVFCFAAPVPPYRKVPESVAESLNLIGLATWSVKEVARLSAELKTVTGRLASRKLVERAKAAMQAEKGLSEEQAYEYMRSLSRRRRITLAELSEEILRESSNRPAVVLHACNPAPISE